MAETSYQQYLIWENGNVFGGYIHYMKDGQSLEDILNFQVNLARRYMKKGSEAPQIKIVTWSSRDRLDQKIHTYDYDPQSQTWIKKARAVN